MTRPAPSYDAIGGTYPSTRRTDRRLAAAIRAALGDVRSVVNVGAGTGSYEPPDLDVLAVEPSEVMLAQRPPDAAPAVRGAAERLPLADASVDAAMAVLSDHHWRDRAAGLRELRRVARRRVVLVNADPVAVCDFWLAREYLPGFVGLVRAPLRRPGAWEAELRAALGPLEIRPVPVPWDCVDGFWLAYWRRPRAYLDPAVRANISVFHRLAPEEVRDGLARLRRDLEDGSWRVRHGDLLARSELDVGLRMVVAECVSPAPGSARARAAGRAAPGTRSRPPGPRTAP